MRPFTLEGRLRRFAVTPCAVLVCALFFQLKSASAPGLRLGVAL